jgi:hypothetical protein
MFLVQGFKKKIGTPRIWSFGRDNNKRIEKMECNQIFLEFLKKI